MPGSLGGLIAADQVVLSFKDRSILAPILIMPGHADGCATVYLGYGRRSAGRVGSQQGYNAYAIRTTDAQWNGPGLQISKTGDKVDLAVTQLQHMIDTEALRDRDLVRSGKLEDYKHDPSLYPAHGHGTPEKHEGENTPSLYPEYEYTGYKWGMTIDLNACVGCNACVVSCQAENNIPVVGKEQVSRGREMHWLRIDSYFKGTPEDPETYFQPVPCMHCENAPCEVVCPVAATVHSSEGLNDMVYNRCVGTRYCSNNCPYKVRRFNFLLYQDWDTPGFKMMRNPDVYRAQSRRDGEMHLLRSADQPRADQAEKEDRAIRDGEVKTACQSVCPTEAIIFGDINDSGSRVAKLKAEPRNYGSAGRVEHATEDDLSRSGSQPESRTGEVLALWRIEQDQEHPHESVRPETSIPPVIRPGHTFATVTDKISSIALTRRTPLAWFIGAGISFLLALLLFYTIGYLVLKGIGIWGNNIPVGWAFDIINFVWWIGIGHAGTLISAILLLLRQTVANIYQPFRGGDDTVCGSERGDIPRLPHGPAVARLLVVSLPEHDGHLPAISKPVDLGRVRGFDLRDRVGAILVHRLDTRFRNSSRPREAAHGQDDLRHAGDGLARVGRALAPLRDDLSFAGGACHAACDLGPHSRQLRFRRGHSPRMARDHLPALLRRGRDLCGFRDGADAGHTAQKTVWPGRLHHDAPSQEHGEDHARNGADSRLRLYDGDLHGLVQREHLRAIHDLRTASPALTR